MLFDRSGKAKRRRELKNELKELQRAFTAAGCGKAEAAGRCKELGETIELGETLCDGYRDARGHLSGARDAIPKLLDCMGESPVDEVEKSLQSLMAHLERAVYFINKSYCTYPNRPAITRYRIRMYLTHPHTLTILIQKTVIAKTLLCG